MGRTLSSRSFLIAAALLCMLSACRKDHALAEGKAGAAGWVETFKVAPENFVSVGKNKYFVLEIGYRLSYEGKKGHTLAITVLNETRLVDGVQTRVVEERESEDGALSEISRNYFAMDKATGDVYYFGEDVDEYKDGTVVGHGGSWLSGRNGAKYGLMMPGEAKVGARYCQEHAPGVAMDRAEIVSVTEKLTTPAGSFEGCLRTEETSDVEAGKKRGDASLTEAPVAKSDCPVAEGSVPSFLPGIGLILDEDLKLVRHGRENAPARAAD